MEALTALVQAKIDYEKHQASKVKPAAPQDQRPKIEALHRSRGK